MFLYVDILGYSEMITISKKCDQQEKFFLDLYAALHAGRLGLEDKHPGSEDFKKLIKTDLFALKAFTDNIVIGWPIHDDGEIELGNAITKVANFQFEMVSKGFFLRGAISIGDAFVDDIAVFGDALEQAYKGEDQLARDPRIILMPSAIAAVKNHISYYKPQAFAPQVDNLLCDADNQWFVNYLDLTLLAVEEQGPFYDEFLLHKRQVEARLNEFRDRPTIFSKYAWVAGYHNYFCDIHSGYFGNEHKIDTALFQARPKNILDT